MLKRLTIAFIFFGIGGAGASELVATPKVDVCFSPNGGCTDRIVQEISAARNRIRVQAYSFTSAPIAKAILEPKKRGVDCEVILDKSQQTQNYSEFDFFFNGGVPTAVFESPLYLFAGV